MDNGNYLSKKIQERNMETKSLNNIDCQTDNTRWWEQLQKGSKIDD